MNFKLTLFVLLIAFSVMGCSKTPEATVRSFYGAIEKGEIGEAKKYLSSKMIVLGDAYLSAVLSDATTQTNSCGNIKDLSVKVSGEGAVRTISTTITFKGKCPLSTEKAKLIQEDGIWKISFDLEPANPFGGAATLYDAVK